ncbi:hypothetical protein OS493_038550 [Desmophyllum pertusum]|uniref:G-protein coupled receptors family 1 profile domain-containing protein n=1 Tax=Desmophyllum pertusum TaxID=174260 RepID=A0A9X0CQ73_9CNID|nr:hypothetical protein OS493_038550 [Desmophyllum pertusum]
MADWETILFTVLNSATVIVGSCANLLIIVSFFVFNSARQPTELLLVSLSVADFLVCAVYQPLLVIRFNHPDQTLNQPGYVSSMAFFGFSLMTASMNGLLAVNFDRFVAIYLPYKYMTWITEVNTAVLISISWVISLATGILNSSRNPGVIGIVNLYITIIILLVAILYGAIYKEARKQARRIIDQSMVGARVLPNRRHLTDRATRGVGLVLITTLLCWLPLILSPVLLANLKTDEDFSFSGDFVVRRCRMCQLLYQSLHLLLQVLEISAQCWKAISDDSKKCWRQVSDQHQQAQSQPDVSRSYGNS